MDNKEFTSARVSQTATIALNGPIETIFPLFGAFEERKWAKGWNPELIYPETEVMEEGTTFKTKAPGKELEYIWIVTKHEPDKNRIQYLVHTENRFWTITIVCFPLANGITSAKVNYTYTGLNERGNQLNEKAIQEMFKQGLKDWENEINGYLTR